MGGLSNVPTRTCKGYYQTNLELNFAACRTVGKLGKSTELIWCNYDPEKVELYSQKL